MLSHIHKNVNIVEHTSDFIPPVSSFSPIYLHVSRRRGTDSVLKPDTYLQIRSGFDDSCEVTMVTLKDNGGMWSWNRQWHYPSIMSALVDIKLSYEPIDMRFSSPEEVFILPKSKL